MRTVLELTEQVCGQAQAPREMLLHANTCEMKTSPPSFPYLASSRLRDENSVCALEAICTLSGAEQGDRTGPEYGRAE
jgi:hypothetical protein